MLDIFQLLLYLPKFLHLVLVLDGEATDFLVHFIDFILYSGLLLKQHDFLCFLIGPIGGALIFL